MKKEIKKELCNHQWRDIEFGEGDTKEYGKQCKKCGEVEWEEEEFELEERIKDWVNFWFKEKYDAGGRSAIKTSLLDFIKKELKRSAKNKLRDKEYKK